MSLEEVIKNYWFVFISFTGIIGTWFTMKSKIEEQEKRIIELESVTKFLEKSYNSVSLDIREIKTNLEYIKNALKI